MKSTFAGLIAALMAFAVLAHGAYDLWAATIVYLGCAFLLAAWLLHCAWSRDRESGVRIDLVLAGFLVAAALTLSFFHSVNPAESRMEWLNWLCALALFLLAPMVFRADSELEKIAGAMVPVFWVQGVLVFYQQIRGSTPFLGQVGGSLINANWLAALFLVWMPVLIAQTFRHWRDGWKRWFWLSGLVCNVAGFCLAYSTWGMISLILVSPLFLSPKTLGRYIRTDPRFLGAAGAAGVLGVIFILWWKFHHTDLWSAGGRATWRLDWWTAGLSMFWDRPWTGVGIGNFSSAYLAYKPAMGQNVRFAHNSIVQLLAETGVAGAIAVMILIGYWLRRIWLDVEAVEKRWPFVCGAVLLMVYSVNALSVECLAILLSLGLFLGLALSETRGLARKPKKSVAIIVAVGAVAMTPYLLSPFFASRNALAAEYYLSEGSVDQAVRAASAAAQLDPLSWEVERVWARSYFSRYRQTHHMEDIQQAVQHQQRAIGLNRLHGYLWLEWASYLAQQGNKPDAERALRRATELHALTAEFERDRPN